MYILFSGEGPTDLGSPQFPNRVCNAASYERGPLVDLTDQIVVAKGKPSFLANDSHGFVPKNLLSIRAKNTRERKHALPGKKTAKETGYFYKNARALALIALDTERAIGIPVVAVLFRDADGSAGNRDGHWADKWKSMKDGFSSAAFDRGVPMLPRPKSEAWMLCALQKNQNPNTNGAGLETRHGSSSSPNSVKQALANFRKGISPSRQQLKDWVADRTILADNITHNSFRRFRTRLEEVI